jgi:hypothetical protein
MPPRGRLTAEAVYDCLKRVYRGIEFDLRAQGKRPEDWVPAWYVHLPSGEKPRIRLINTEGPLVRFTTFDDRFILLAPDAVAVTIEPQPGDSEGFPIEFLDAGEEDEPPAPVPN